MLIFDFYVLWLLQANDTYEVVISIDAAGMVEYWSTSTYDFPNNVKFQYKSDTDLYEFAKAPFPSLIIEIISLIIVLPRCSYPGRF